MPKFIIIDHSLCDLTGHYYEYDVSIAEAAERLGYEPIIVSNIQFSQKLYPQNIKVIPGFSVNWAGVAPNKFNILAFIVNAVKNIKSIPSRIKKSFRFTLKISYLFLLIATPQLSSLWYKVEASLSRLMMALKSDATKIVSPIYFIFGKLINIKPFFKALPITIFIWLIKVFVGLLKEISRIIIVQSISTLRLILGKNQSAFAKELKKLLSKKIIVTEEDHIFIPTIGIDQLEELLAFISQGNIDSTPSYHILLRRDCRESIVMYTKGIGLKACLHRFYGSGLSNKKVTFYTDTDELTKQHNDLSPIRFITAPIPFRHENIKDKANFNDIDQEAINIVYLGDARTEKGYQYLPQLLDALWLSHIQPGKVKFTIQSNFNIPGGEPGMMEARLRLEQYPAHTIQLLKDTLPTETYYNILSDADIVIIPYLPKSYGARSSGILVEALAAGKPVVVPANTWMANQVDYSRASIYKSPNEISDAVLRILNNYQEFAQAAYNYRLRWQSKHSPNALIKCLTVKQDLLPEPCEISNNITPSIVYIIDADSLVQKVGAGQVARNQLDYLSRCGYRIYGLFFFKNPLLNDEDYNLYLSQAQKSLREIFEQTNLQESRLIETWFLRIKFEINFKNITKIWDYITDNKSSLKKDLFIRENIDIPTSLYQFVKTQKIDAVFINYITNFPLLKKLNLHTLPIVCEMHDIQSHQYAIYNNRDINSNEFLQECNLLNKCSVVLANNFQELEKVQSITKNPVFNYVPYIGRLSPTKVADINGCMNLIDVLKLSGSAKSLDFTQNQRLRQEDSIDLLYVSSYHAPNIYSLKWFFHEVYIPYLADKNINLFIVGNIMDFGDLGDISHPKIFVTGVVENLRPLYSATRLVILPVKIGAGFNIKTIESLSMGKPVVATSTALKGLNYDRELFPVFDEPKAYGYQILKLLNSSQIRLEQAKQGFNLVQSHYKQENFDEAMNKALINLFKDKALLPQPLTSIHWEPKLVELSPGNIQFNRIIERFVNRDDFGQDNFCQELYKTLVKNYFNFASHTPLSVNGSSQINSNQLLNLTEKIQENIEIKVRRICILIPEDIRFLYPTIKLVADQIVESGFSVDIFCLSCEGENEIEEKHSFKTITYQTNLDHYTKSGQLEFIAKAITVLGSYDAYIGLNELGLSAAYFLAEKLFHKPLIAYMLEIPTIPDKDKFHKYIDTLFQKVDAFIDVDPGRLNYRSTNLQITSNKFYIRNLPRKKEIDNIAVTDISRPDDKLVLWYHGTISSFHGITEILDGYYRSKLVSELHLTGPFLNIEYRQELLKRIGRESKPVFLHKPVYRDVVLKRAIEIASIAICFYPFRYSNKQDYLGRLYANPAKVFDYMALGIPAITSDNPSLIEYVQEEGWGICVSPEDADAVAEAMDLLASDYHLRLKMSKRAKELFTSKYNLEQESLPFINFLKNITKSEESKYLTSHKN